MNELGNVGTSLVNKPPEVGENVRTDLLSFPQQQQHEEEEEEEPPHQSEQFRNMVNEEQARVDAWVEARRRDQFAENDVAAMSDVNRIVGTANTKSVRFNMSTRPENQTIIKRDKGKERVTADSSLQRPPSKKYTGKLYNHPEEGPPLSDRPGRGKVRKSRNQMNPPRRRKYSQVEFSSERMEAPYIDYKKSLIDKYGRKKQTSQSVKRSNPQVPTFVREYKVSQHPPRWSPYPIAD